MDTRRICSTCGSENVRNVGEGGVAFCEDCDGVTETIEVSDEYDNSDIEYPDDQFMYDNLEEVEE